MSIHAKRNQYLGVNAHASSWLQNREGEWVSFHHDHITDLTRGLNVILPVGYEARSEHSLQIREITPRSEAPDDKPNGHNTTRSRHPQPDTTIYKTHAGQFTSDSKTAAQPTQAIAPVIDTMDIRDDELSAVVIYRIEEQDQLGKPVARIELLSPTNKPPGEGYEQYRGKRNAALRSGMPLIEIDYLHQEPSVIPALSHYPDDPESHPYQIIVTDPRPSVKAGRTEIYGFDADQPIPCFNIPLDQGYVPAFDLGQAYNTTFENTPTFHRVIDYSLLPLRPETYSAADRQRIVQRMVMTAIAYESERNLNDSGPFPIDADLVAAYLREHDLGSI